MLRLVPGVPVDLPDVKLSTPAVSVPWSSNVGARHVG
jgi:hypothetical protein